MGWARLRAHFESWWNIMVIAYDMEVAKITGERGTTKPGKEVCGYIKQ